MGFGQMRLMPAEKAFENECPVVPPDDGVDDEGAY